MLDFSHTQITEIPDEAFINCTNLKEIILPNTIQRIGTRAFSGCENLGFSALNEKPIKIDLTNAVSIGESAFEGCVNLKTIILGDNLTYLGNRAFKDCKVLEGVNLSSSLSNGYVGEYAFENCLAMNNAYIKSTKLARGLFKNTASLVNVKLPEGITVIPDECFMNSGVTRINIPTTVVEFGASSFEQSNIMELVLPDSLKIIKARAFKNATGLQKLNLNKVETIEDEAFMGLLDSKLKAVTIPATVSNLGNKVFAECTYLTSVTFENNVYGTYTFMNDLNLSNVIFNNIRNITSIPEGLFYGCAKYNDQSLLNQSNITNIGAYAYYGTSLGDLTLKSHILEVGSFAFASIENMTTLEIHTRMISAKMFANCINLTKATIGIEVVEVRDFVPTNPEDKKMNEAFIGCVKLSNLIIQNKIIGSGMFKGCEGLLNVTIPASVDTIYDRAFVDCINLNHVTFENKVLGSNMFENCKSLKRVVLTNFEVIAGSAFRNSYIEELEITANIIEDYAFADMSKLTKVIMNGALEKLGNYAFYNCDALRQVKIPVVTTMGTNVFEDCLLLESVDLSSANKIGEYMFNNCTKLAKVVIPEAIETIGRNAFSNCTSLASVDNKANIFSDYMFENCTSLTNITVNNNTNTVLVDGKTQDAVPGVYVFKGCTGLQTVYYYETELTEGIFSGCTSLAQVVFKNNSAASILNKISTLAFEACANLISIDLPDSLKIIGTKAFKNSGIQMISIPDSVDLIEFAALEGLYSLSSLKIPFAGSTPANGVMPTDNKHYLGYIFGNEEVTTRTVSVVQKHPNSLLDANVTFTIPQSLKVVRLGNKERFISYGAFSGLSMVTGISLPTDVVEGIGEYAFSETNIEQIVIPYGLSTFGNYAFMNCKSLLKVLIPLVGDTSSLTAIPNYAFAGCTKLTTFAPKDSVAVNTNINLFGSIVSVGAHAFSDCENIDTVYYVNSNLNIGAYAFSGCKRLTKFTPYEGEGYVPRPGTVLIKNTMDTGSYAFSGCEAIEHAILENDTVKSGLFNNALALKTVKYNDAIIEVGEYAFNNCQNLTLFDFNTDKANGIYLSNNIKSVGAYAFANAKLVDRIDYTNNLTQILDYAFLNIDCGTDGDITTLVVKDSVSLIGEGAFAGWNSLVNVTIPFVGKNNKENNNSSGVFGHIFGKLNTGISGTVQRNETYYIPSTITKVKVTLGVVLSQYAFANCTNLNIIDLPTHISGTMTKIGAYSFLNCSGLTSFVIGAKVESIDSYAMKGCYNLTKLSLPFLGQNKDTIGNNSHIGYIFGTDSYNESYQITKYSQYYGFYLPNKLTEVTVTNDLQIAGAGFTGSRNINKITISARTATIDYSTFNACSGLTELIIPFVGYSRNNSTNSQGLFGYIFGGGSYTGGIGVKQYFSTRGEQEPNSYYSTHYIPSNLRKVTITDEELINYGAFMNCTMIEELNLNEGITKINSRAFENCTGLSKMIIPTTVTTMDKRLFDKCSNLVDLSLPFVGYSSITPDASDNEFGNLFGNESFNNSTGAIIGRYGAKYYFPLGLTTVRITETSTLANSAFYNCTFIKNVIFENNKLTKINDYAFYGCRQIEHLVLPISLVAMGTNVFENCTGLQDVTFESNIESIAPYTFKGCTNLVKLLYKASTNEVFFDSIKVIEEGAFEDATSFVFTSLNKIERLGNNAFRNCDSLVNVTITEALTNAGAYVFENCDALTTVTFNSPVIGVGMFKDCYVLNNVSLNKHTIKVSDEAFMNCTGLDTITLNDGLQEIGISAFENCTNLSNIILPNSLTKIGDKAFKGSTLEAIIVPAKVTTIGNDVFMNNGRLKKAVLKNELLGVGMFKYCYNLRDVFLNIGVNLIADYAFYHATSLKYFKTFAVDSMPQSVSETETGLDISNSSIVKIGTSAFEGAMSLPTLNLGNKLTTISHKAFYQNGAITNLVLPTSLISIGSYAFAYPYELNGQKLYLDSSLERKPIKGADGYSYDGMPLNISAGAADVIATKEVWTLNGVATAYESSSTFTANNDGYYYAGTLKTIFRVHPNDVVSKADVWFINNEITYLKNDLNTLYVEPKLTNVTYPVNTSKITGAYMFSGQTSLKNVVMPEGFTEIAEGMFMYCTALTRINLPISVNSINAYAFKHSGLVEFSINPEVTNIGESVFEECSELTTVNIYNGILSKGMFKNNKVLETVRIYSSIAEIPDYAFYGCDNLKTVAFMDTRPNN